MPISTGTEYLTTAFTDTLVFNVDWFLSLVFIFLTLLVITRDVRKWAILALPVQVGWHILGLTPSIIAYISFGMIFVLEVLSISGVGQPLRAKVKEVYRQAGNREKILMRSDIRKKTELAIAKGKKKIWEK